MWQRLNRLTEPRFFPHILGLFCALATPALSWAEENAAPRTASLSWVRLPGAESCIPTRELAQSVEAHLGRQLFLSASQGELSVEGRIGPSEASGEFEAVVVVSDSFGAILGQRELRSTNGDCVSLDEELSLVIAIMIDPEAALTAPETPSSEPGLEPEPQPVEPEQHSTTDEQNHSDGSAEDGRGEGTESRRAEESGWRFDLLTSALLGVGYLPRPAAGVAVVLIIDPPRFWPFQIEVGSMLGSKADANGQEASARFDEVFAGAFLCGPWDQGWFALHGCAGVLAGGLHVRGEGFVQSERQWLPSVDGVARLQVLFRPVRFLVVRIAASIEFPFFRHTFRYIDEDGTDRELFRAPPVAGTFEIGVGAYFH